MSELRPWMEGLRQDISKCYSSTPLINPENYENWDEETMNSMSEDFNSWNTLEYEAMKVYFYASWLAEDHQEVFPEKTLLAINTLLSLLLPGTVISSWLRKQDVPLLDIRKKLIEARKNVTKTTEELLEEIKKLAEDNHQKGA